MKPNKDQILELIKKSVHATAPEFVLVPYDSYVRGEYSDDSNIYLLILLDGDKITGPDETRIRKSPNEEVLY